MRYRFRHKDGSWRCLESMAKRYDAPDGADVRGRQYARRDRGRQDPAGARRHPGAAGAGDEDGGRRPARRRRRARLQQPADRHRRLCRAGVGDAQYPRFPRRGSRRDQAGRASRQPADAAAPGLQPQAGAPSRSARHQRRRARGRAAGEPADRRGHRAGAGDDARRRCRCSAIGRSSSRC